MNSQQKINNHPTKPTIGYLANNNKAAWNAYKERASIARKHGILLVLIPAKTQNIEQLLLQNEISCRSWTGSSMKEIKVPAPKTYYDRTSVRSQEKNDASRLIAMMEKEGLAFVNPRSFRELCADKWSTYEKLESYGITMPTTAIFEFPDLFTALNEHQTVFVKKRQSSQGDGQHVFIKLKKDRYKVISSDTQEEIHCDGSFDVMRYCVQNNIDGDYIVQEGINVDTIDDRIYDFRAIFQRDAKSTIQLTAIYTRVGAPESKQANIGKKGHPQDITVLFEHSKKVREEIRKTGLYVASKMSDNFGEVGLDFVYDKNMKLYLLEANSKPGSKGLREIREWNPQDDVHVQNNVLQYEYTDKLRHTWGVRLHHFLTRPLLYAKYLDKNISG